MFPNDMGETEVRRMLVAYEPATGGPSVNAVGRDAALGGLFIETNAPLAVGALLTVELKSPTASVTLEARVFSSRKAPEGPDRPPGMGVRFLDLPGGMLTKLQAILTHHRPPARTRLGVGDENEMLWASAGGRDGIVPTQDEQDDALALAGTLEVEGRPTVDMGSHGVGTREGPSTPRHPTPRMVPLVQPPPPPRPTPLMRSPEPTPSSFPAPVVAVQTPDFAPPSKGKIAFIMIAILALLAIAAVVGQMVAESP